MQWKNPFRRDPDAPKEGSSLALRAGGYSLVMTALVLVIAVAGKPHRRDAAVYNDAL